MLYMSSEDSYPDGVTHTSGRVWSEAQSLLPTPRLDEPRRGDRAKGIREASCCHTLQTSDILHLPSSLLHLPSSLIKVPVLAVQSPLFATGLAIMLLIFLPIAVRILKFRNADVLPGTEKNIGTRGI